MKDEQYVDNKGHCVRTPHVSNKDQENDREDEQCSLPISRLIAQIINGEESLNDGPQEKRSRRQTSLPG